MKSILAAAAALLLTTTVASAETLLYRGGSWETNVTTNTEGKPMCVMKVTGSVSVLTVKYSGVDIFLHLFKMGWAIPKGTSVPSWIQFDGNQRWPMSGTGGMLMKNVGYVEYEVKRGGELDFIRLFAGSNKMHIGFEQGTQSPFIIDMNGSHGAALAFTDCGKKIDAQLAQPNNTPQPFNANPQPFGRKYQDRIPQPAKKDDGSI